MDSNSSLPARALALQALSGHRQQPVHSATTDLLGAFAGVTKPPAALQPSKKKLEPPQPAGERPRFPSRGQPVSTSNRPQLQTLSLLIAAEAQFDKLDVPLAIETYFSCPVEITTLFNTGQLYLYMLDHANARDCFRLAVKQEPKFALGWFSLATTLANDNDKVECYRRCLQLLGRRGFADYRQLGLAYVLRQEDVTENLKILSHVNQRGSEGDGEWELAMVPVGAIFRVPDWKAKQMGRKAGESTNWGFLGEGQVVAMASDSVIGSGKDDQIRKAK